MICHVSRIPDFAIVQASYLLGPHSFIVACSAGLMLHLIRQNGARTFVAALPVLEDGQKRAGKLGTAAQLLQISRQAQVHQPGI